LESLRIVLAEQVRKYMPPLYLQKAKPGTPEYFEALKMGAKALQPEVVNICNEYRDVAMKLEPDDPNAGSIEKLISGPPLVKSLAAVTT